MKYAVAFTAVVIALGYGYHAGTSSVQKEWDADKLRVAAEILILTEKANTVTTKIEYVYVDKVKTINKVGETITKYVDRVITPATDAKCVIPQNFILLHDSAILNISPTEDHK